MGEQLHNPEPDQQNDPGEEEAADNFRLSLVLSLVVPHLSEANDLKNLRLANNVCRQASLDEWRRRMTLRLFWRRGRNRPCVHCHTLDHFYDGIYVAEFLQLLQASEEQGIDCPYQLVKRPFSKYRIVNWDILQEASDDGMDKLQEFLTGYGHHIKSLELDHFSISNNTVGGFKEAFSGPFLRTLTNLEGLSIILRGPEMPTIDTPNSENSNDAIRPSAPSPSPKLETIDISICSYTSPVLAGARWTELFRFAPNVKKLALGNKACSVVRALKLPMSDGKYLQLSSIIQRGYIHADGESSYDSLRIYLNEAKPKLRELKLSDCWDEDGGATVNLREVLLLCQNSLEVLSLSGWKRDRKQPPEESLSRLFEGLEFPFLTKLYMTIESFISLEALKNLSNLNELWITTGNCVRDLNQRIIRASEEEEATREIILWERLELFHLDYYRCTQTSLRIMGRWMPNLKRLELPLNTSMIPVVREVWPNLEGLKALRGSLLEGEPCPILTSVNI